MSDEEGTTVTVETNDAPEPTTDDAPDVVVVDTGGDDSSSDDLAIGVALGALTAEVATIRERLDALDARTTVAEVVAERAEDTAETAVDIAVEAAEEATEAVADAEEVAEETVEEFIEPQREHFMWRNPVKLRRRGEQ